MGVVFSQGGRMGYPASYIQDLIFWYTRVIFFSHSSSTDLIVTIIYKKYASSLNLVSLRCRGSKCGPLRRWEISSWANPSIWIKPFARSLWLERDRDPTQCLHHNYRSQPDCRNISLLHQIPWYDFENVTTFFIELSLSRTTLFNSLIRSKKTP